MRKSNRERIQEAKRTAFKQTEMTLEDLFKLLLNGDFNPTQQRFIYDSTRLKAYKGPAGCAKTSTICAAGLARALLQPGSKGLVARHDYNDLMDTTALRLTEMVERLPKGILVDRDKSPPMKWWIQPAIPDAPISQITFMGLKGPIGSYEFNWAIVDEADECDERRIHEINSRLRNLGGDYMLGLAFNPPDKHHWLYTVCTGRDFQDKFVKPAIFKCFEPQPRENARNLPENYYENLEASMPEDMVQRLVRGEWGATFDGQPVYRQFKYPIHVKEDLTYDPESALLRFWDFGYHRPACIWAQVDSVGRLLHFHEFLGHDVEARQFARQCVAITATKFGRCPQIIDFGDPAVVQKKDTGRTLSELAKEGIHMQYQSSTIERGLNIIRLRLEQLIEGEPAMQYDRKGCPILISAFRGGYRMDKAGIKPLKDGFYDHLADAERYGVLNVFGGGVSSARFHELPTDLSYNPSTDFN